MPRVGTKATCWPLGGGLGAHARRPAEIRARSWAATGRVARDRAYLDAMALVVAPSFAKRVVLLLSFVTAMLAVLLSARAAEAAIAIDPAYATAEPGGVLTFHATGGSGGYQWSMAQNPSGGSVDASGVYHAGLFPLVDDQVKVTDSAGESATATIGVTYWAALVVRQPTGTMPPRASRPLDVSGGVPPYQFSYVSNASGGAVSSAGLFTAGSRGKVVDVVRITDSVGQSATAVFSVGEGLSITPASAKVAPHASLELSASGGDGTKPRWSFTANRSNGSLDAATGSYRAGPTAHTADIVRAEDALGNRAEVGISVGDGVAIAPTVARTSPRGTIAFAGFGGTSAYVWSLSQSPSGGTIDEKTGVYVAGPVGSVKDEVSVADSAGNWATTAVDVGPALSLSPPTSTVAPRGKVLLTVAGGSGSYAAAVIEVNASGGTIGSDLVYVAGPKQGRDTIVVEDSVGSRTHAVVDVDARAVKQTDTSSSATIDGANLAGGGAGGGCRASGTRGNGGAALLAIGAILALRRRRHR